MAGDWLKFELDTPDKPEVMALAGRLGIPRTQVLGCLVMIWRWFNRQTVDGHAPVTLASLSEIAGVPGFAEAMQEEHWLSTSDKGIISVPAFDMHNGESAKKRALSAKRSQRYRHASVTPPVTQSSRKPRDQEKNKEDIKTTGGIHPPKANGKGTPGWWETPAATFDEAKRLGVSTRGVDWIPLKAAVRDALAKPSQPQTQQPIPTHAREESTPAAATAAPAHRSKFEDPE